MAQAASGLRQCLNAQQTEHGTHDTDPTPNDGLAVLTHASYFEPVSTLGRQQFVQQPVQTILRHNACWPTRCHQHVGNGSYRSGGAVCGVPQAGMVGVQGLIKHRLGSNLGNGKRFLCKLTVREIPVGPGNAAHTE